MESLIIRDARVGGGRALKASLLLQSGLRRGTLLRRDFGEAFVQLSISNRTVNGVAVVDCDGRLVFGEESASLRDAVRSLLMMNKQIVLNLGGVSYIDSGGLGTLVALYTTAQNSGGAIRLAALTKRVGDLLQVTKLVTVFEVHETVEQAVNSFQKGVAA
jgi:anti-sigma B factor antagonist